MAYKQTGLHVKFTKNNVELGYAIGYAEGDYLAFPKRNLKELIGRDYMKILEGSTLTIIDSHTNIKVTRMVEFEEDQTICIYCGLDSVIPAQVIPLTKYLEKNTIQRVKEYIMELVA